MNKIERLKELVALLNEASKAYYQESREIMSNLEYDKLYDELIGLEEETGVVLGNSPSVNVGYEVLTQLPKEEHLKPMLSLDKTKEVGRLSEFLGNREGLLSWKLDGLTVVLTYENGVLVKGVTRGNGVVGEVITNNCRVFSNLPAKIPFKQKLILRGEAVISYEDFEKINSSISDETAKYKNPRNLCSGSVRQLNNKIAKERNVQFFGFSLVEAEGMNFRFREDELNWLKNQGFHVVEFIKVKGDSVDLGVENFSKMVPDNPVPSDGLVLILNDIEYGMSLGITAKFPRDAIAFKWRDEIVETTLTDVKWNASRTGLINPVAVFEPVEIEGTTVSRASLHNLSMVEELKVGIGDKITVYKANMIIPQVAENLTKSNNLTLPATCPVCGSHVVIQGDKGVKTLNCPNPECLAKNLKGISHFVTRDAMNIEGLSEQTLEKFIDMGIVKDYVDIFRLFKHKEIIVNTEGFGEKSYENLIKSIDKSRTPKTSAFLYSLGVPNIGKANAKTIANFKKNVWSDIVKLRKDELIEIEGVGDIMAEAFVEYFSNPKNLKRIEDLLEEVKIDEGFIQGGSTLEGLTFVITGKLEGFSNRDELKEKLESLGAKVAGSVSNSTSFLINNDILSNSGKNKKAKELGVEIISEKDLVNRFL